MSYDKKDRPVTVEDLTKSERAGTSVLSLRLSEASGIPGFARALTEALVVAEEDGRLELDASGWQTEVRLVPTEEQLEVKLEEAQRSWDNATKKIEKALAGEELDDWDRHVAKTAAKARGIDLGWEED